MLQLNNVKIQILYINMFYLKNKSTYLCPQNFHHFTVLWNNLTKQESDDETTAFFTNPTAHIMLQIKSQNSSETNYGITEWLRLEETSGGRQVQPPVQAGLPTASCPVLCPEKTKWRNIHKTSQDTLPSFSAQNAVWFFFLLIW